MQNSYLSRVRNSEDKTGDTNFVSGGRRVRTEGQRNL